MEPRLVFSVAPVVIGVTYHEQDTGQDTTPDHFEVTFQGGSSTTQLTQFVINGDKDNSGTLSDSDMFFDVAAGGPGVGGQHNFVFNATGSSGIIASDIESFSVSPDGLKLTVNVKNFQAGDKLAFTIDVDEVEGLLQDKIASGVEFEQTVFAASFSDLHYTFASRDVSVQSTLENNVKQTQTEGVFFDHYDDLFARGSQLAGATVQLRSDNDGGQSDRSAGAIDVYDLIPKNVSISGHVFEDRHLGCEPTADLKGISNVNLTLQKLNTTLQKYETVANTKTDATGYYEFGMNLNLKPGVYRVVEAQPNGFLDVNATAGKVAGVKSGIVANDKFGNENIIANIHIPLGGTTATDYDFLEVKPISLSGRVWHDRNDDGQLNSGEEGIANIQIRVTRLGSADTTNPDPFAGTSPIFVRTAADGTYSVEGIAPGLYEIVEVSSYPPTDNPLAGFIDGKDSLGKVNGQTAGLATNDKVTQIKVCAGENGVDYNFGELKPTSINGYVSVATPEGNCLEPTSPNFTGLAGVTVNLYDSSGALVATTTTNAGGLYEFKNLRNGTYTVVEVQPNGYLDGDEHVGRVDGQLLGANSANDRFSGIVLTSGQAGTRYDFCEHRPAEICGTVWYDRNDNGLMESSEQRIGGVLIELFDKQGNKVSETRTDAEGRYCFLNLYAGEYSVRETQPVSFVDGKDSLGSVSGIANGQVSNDRFSGIVLRGGQKGDQYNFGEIKHGSISGMVHADTGKDCVYDPAAGDKPLAGVTLVLLSEQGQEIARTQTDAQGHYTFSDLRPGTYTVRELGPSGYIDGKELAGTVDGQTRGTVTDDLVSGITLFSGDNGINYDFCEHIPAEICGTVYHDRNNNGVQDSGEEGIGSTKVVLYDAVGQIVAETTTSADGKYCFTNLVGGEFCVKEVQPAGFIDGKDSSGKVNGLNVGQTKNDELCKIVINGGEKGTDYNFGELKLAKISGYVLVDADGNCTFDATPGDKPIANVKIDLLDSTGIVVATTKTGADGAYSFHNVLPGTYSVRQTQPKNYFNVDQMVGKADGQAGSGDASGINAISNIVISSGQTLVQYNFCEDIPAEIHGRVWEDGPAFQSKDGQVPDGYRMQRDGIYHADVDQAISGVKMQLYFYIDPTSGDIAPRPVTLKDVLPGIYTHLGSNPDVPVFVTTDASGQYSFTGLKAGNYIVLQQQPAGFVDANDLVGSTTGFSFNSTLQASVAPAAVLNLFSTEQVMDSVINIRVNAGGISVQNNFTEVRAISEPGTPYLPPINPPPPGFGGPPPGLPGGFLPGLAGAQPGMNARMMTREIALQTTPGGNIDAYTWHLSVINAGTPRAVGESDSAQTQWLQAGYLNSEDWNRFEMDDAIWSFATVNELGELSLLDRSFDFGMIQGIPLTGDFDGDGSDEIVVYHEGYWMIDINHNGRWDQSDLLVRLGKADDQPVVGDWDGDGKEDIGIYGRMWDRDPEAIENDPGLPNPDNYGYTKPKNIPPTHVESTSGARIMKLTSHGRQRTDLVDHVFGIDDYRHIAVTGDWNGSGIRSIATFDGGTWRLDLNGDGRFNSNDAFASFGTEGDIPLVGDFNGDGVDEIAVYRAGTWIIDSNGDRQMTDVDRRIEYGNANDKPIVGDWNGDGTDDVGLYRAKPNTF